MSSILFISLMNEAGWGSSEELWHKTAVYAANRDHDVTCALFNWPQKKDKTNQLEQAGINILFLPNNGILKRNLVERIQYKFARKSLKKFIEDMHVDVYDQIIINLRDYEIIQPIFQQWYQKLKNYTLLFHSYNEREPFKPNEINVLRNWITNADRVLFGSDKSRDALENRLNMHFERSGTFVNPVNFTPPSENIPFEKQGKYVFTMIAPLNINTKAQDRLIKALACPKWMQRNYVLNIYGEGRDHDRLENFIARKGLTSKIFLKGKAIKRNEIMKETNLVLHISHKDSMPTSILEALAMSRPVLVSPTGDMPKWVRSGENGWITRDTTPDEIEIALEMAWNERNRWEDMGKRSFEIFKKQFPSSIPMQLLKPGGINLSLAAQYNKKEAQAV